MIVRTVQIDQAIANLLQDSHRCQRAIYELAVGSGTRIDSFQKELAVFAWIDPLFFQGSIDIRTLLKFKGSLNRALIGAGSNQRFIRTFSEYQLQGTEDNRFSSTCFSRYDGEARCQIPVQRLDKSKVPDSQRSQGCGHRSTM